MSKKESPLESLTSFLPQGSFEKVSWYLNTYHVQLTITRERKTILGNYQNQMTNRMHRISVNGNLNKYAFLVTLLHEIAHMLTFEKFGHKVLPHGSEWKTCYGSVLSQFIPLNIFPAEIEKVLVDTLSSPGASTCGDKHLTRALRKYDIKSDDWILVEDLPLNSLFRIRGGRIFKKGAKIRSRHKCSEVPGDKVYLFSGVFEVIKVQPNF